jgi:hypothetical protein
MLYILIGTFCRILETTTPVVPDFEKLKSSGLTSYDPKSEPAGICYCIVHLLVQLRNIHQTKNTCKMHNPL